MAVQGADLDGLGRLRSLLERQSGTLQTITAGASSGVAALDQVWAGPDAAQFRTAWNNVHRRSLAAAVAALIEAADTVDRNRRAQEAASAVDGPGFRPGGLPPLSPLDPYDGASPGTEPVPTARPVGDVFSEDYLDAFVGRRVQGENSPELNSLLEAVLADDGRDPARLQAELDRIADIRGVDREAFRAQYATYQQLQARSTALGGPQDPIDLDRHGDFLGSTASLRYGSVIGDVYGIDPVFGALLNPTGGLVGGGNDAYNPGDNDALGYHGIFHDAGGYLLNRQGVGPGYNYLGREDFNDQASPTTGQVTGISWWVGNHPTLDADARDVTALLGPDPNPLVVGGVDALHYLGAEEVIGEASTVIEAGTTIGGGVTDLTTGHPSGLLDIGRGTGNLIVGSVDNAVDLQMKPIELGVDAGSAVGHAVVDHVGDLGRSLNPVPSLFG